MWWRCSVGEREKSPRYMLHGRVVHGHGRGHTVGMPTANLQPEKGSPLPPAGVYAVEALLDGKTYIGVTNVGTRPSVDSGPETTVETLVLDFAGDLYGREMTLYFYRLLRPVQKFSSLEAVKAQVERDGQAARALLAQPEGEKEGAG